jgi:NAD(P)-dependent dehydrogenase (short-subunit alcohol dehydrogenase family)
MTSMHGRRILVTGATGGLGPSLCEALLAVGGEVIAIARRRTGLDDLRAGLAHHERLHVAECDVSDSGGVGKLFASVTKKAPLDAVVHASGAFAWARLAEIEDAEIARLVTANLLATTFVVRESLRHMLARGAGSVVVVAADRVLSPAEGFAVYGAAKAGVVHLVEAAAKEAAPRGVRVNALLPGILDTKDNRAAMPDADASRWTSPADVARAAVFLASDDSKGVTGARIVLPNR